jgi:hypothetical protein
MSSLLEFLEILGCLDRFLKVWCFAESSMERDHFMSPEEAKSFGLVDEVIERRPEALVADSMAIKR